MSSVLNVLGWLACAPFIAGIVVTGLLMAGCLLACKALVGSRNVDRIVEKLP